VLSGALLGAGVWLERQSLFRNYAYGLVAGGWAGIYFTTFAMHEVAAAKLIDSVRALLAARDHIRATLDGVRAAMNSEFDALAAELGNAAPDSEKLKQFLETLKRNWPQKEKDLDVATRRLLTDLGILQAVPAPAPAEKK